jgi:sugar phosphate isomerase/epimerase
MSRRQCLEVLGKTSVLVPVFGNWPFLNTTKTNYNSQREIHIFSKHLQWLNYADMAKTAAEIGFDGVDLTVRPKGHVLPENVETDLPKAVEAIRKTGLKAELLTTGITDAKATHTEKILKTANSLGIKTYRMGWLKYKAGTPIPEQLEAFKIQLAELAEMNKHYGLHGAYQNHAGASVGAALWDTWHIIKDLDPQYLGARYDIRHAMVEGMHSWELSLQLLAPHIRSLDIKDFIWAKNSEKWTVENVPLGEGAVDFGRYFTLLDELKIEGPMTLHMEYPLGGANAGESKLTVPPAQVIEAMRVDLIRLKKLNTSNE